MARTLLIVDDDPVVRQVTCRMLDEAGFLTAAAASAKEAMLLMDADPRQSSRPYELAVIDIRLPDGSGLDLARSIRQRRASLPVLFVSGYPEANGEEPPEGAWAFLPKPFTSEQLLKLVRQLLEAPSSPSVET